MAGLHIPFILRAGNPNKPGRPESNKRRWHNDAAPDAADRSEPADGMLMVTATDVAVVAMGASDDISKQYESDNALAERKAQREAYRFDAEQKAAAAARAFSKESQSVFNQNDYKARTGPYPNIYAAANITLD
jgi:hypothetical protein